MWYAWHGLPAELPDLRSLGMALASAPCYLAGNAFFLLALRRGNLSIVAPLVGLEGGIAAVIGILVLGQGVGALTAIGLVLAVVGGSLAASERGARGAAGAAGRLPARPPTARRSSVTARPTGISPLGVVLTSRAAAVALLGLWLVTRRQPLALGRSMRRATITLGSIDVLAFTLFATAVALGPIAVASVTGAQFATLAAALGVVVLAERLRRRAVRRRRAHADRRDRAGARLKLEMRSRCRVAYRWQSSWSAPSCATSEHPGHRLGRDGRALRGDGARPPDRTFHVEGHHYALVVIDDLEPASVTPYEVRLDGRQVWPPDDGRPPSAIHTRNHERQARLVFGSCRVGAPERPPYTLSSDEHPKGFGIDALWAFSRRLQEASASRGRTACCCSATRSTPTRSRPRRSPSSARGETCRSRPGEEVADFEEYTRLYRESWDDPDIRWLLSTVPSTMIFDDHDVHDDWNISDAWVEEMRAAAWWEERIVGAFMSYWLYQHLGNLAPPELAEEPLLGELRRTRTAARGCARSRTWPTASRPRAAGRSIATSAARASWWSTRARRACSPTAGATWSTRRSGTGSPSTRAATTTT